MSYFPFLKSSLTGPIFSTNTNPVTTKLLPLYPHIVTFFNSLSVLFQPNFTTESAKYPDVWSLDESIYDSFLLQIANHTKTFLNIGNIGYPKKMHANFNSR